MGYRINILLIERQALFVPFLAGLLERDGDAVTILDALPHPARLRELRPDVVCVDVDHLPVRPLDAIRRLRAALPSARLVAYAARADRSWFAAAKGAGADIVLGPEAKPDDFIAAAYVRPSDRLPRRPIAAEGLS